MQARPIGVDVVKNLETNLSSHLTNLAEDKKDTEPQSLSTVITNLPIPDIKDEKREVILKKFETISDAEKQLKALEKLSQPQFTFFKKLTHSKTSQPIDHKLIKAMTKLRRHIIHSILSEVLGIINQKEYQYFARLGHTVLLAECVSMIEKHKETNPIDIPKLREEFKNNLKRIAPKKLEATADCTVTLAVESSILKVNATHGVKVKHNATNHVTLIGSMESIKKTLASLTQQGTDEILCIYTSINHFNVFDIMSVQLAKQSLKSIQIQQVISTAEKTMHAIKTKKEESKQHSSDLLQLEQQEIAHIEALREWIIALKTDISINETLDGTWENLIACLKKIDAVYEIRLQDDKATPGLETSEQDHVSTISSEIVEVEKESPDVEAKGDTPDAPLLLPVKIESTAVAEAKHNAPGVAPATTAVPKTTLWQDFVNILDRLGAAIVALIRLLEDSITQCFTREESPRPALQ